MVNFGIGFKSVNRGRWKCGTNDAKFDGPKWSTGKWGTENEGPENAINIYEGSHRVGNSDNHRHTDKKHSMSVVRVMIDWLIDWLISDTHEKIPKGRGFVCSYIQDNTNSIPELKRKITLSTSVKCKTVQHYT